MALPKFKNKVDIPKGFEEMYHEANGEWVPIESKREGPTQEDVDALKTTLGAVRDDVKTLTDKLKDETRKRQDAETKLQEEQTRKAAEGAGVDDEKLKELREKIYADARAELQKELDDKDAEIERRGDVDGENRRLKLDMVVKKAMLDKGALGDKVDDLYTLTSGSFDLTDDGSPMLKDHPGKDLGVFIEDTIKPKYKEWFSGTKAGGGGAGGHEHHIPAGGITADDVLLNPAAAIDAARAAGAAK
jgi:hypothetical protein